MRINTDERNSSEKIEPEDIIYQIEFVDKEIDDNYLLRYKASNFEEKT